MNDKPHPAWLLRTLKVATSAFVIVLGATGCARFGEELSHGSRVSSTSTVARTTTALAAQTESTSARFATSVAPRLNFAASSDTAAESLLADGDRPLPMNGLCPADMASIDDRFCIDRYEASLVEVLASGEEQAWPYYLPVEGHAVRAVSRKGVYPQGYISEKQAISACRASGKRLCKSREWKKACQGPVPTKFGYGDQRQAGVCNDQGRSPMRKFFNAEFVAGTAWTWDKMNDPKLNQLEGTLAETGSHEGCTNGYGVHDMVGNIHEWVDDPKGTFQGGYYQDVTQNGDGCSYRTDAHEAWYHDYSTGFRCCADVGQ